MVEAEETVKYIISSGEMNRKKNSAAL